MNEDVFFETVRYLALAEEAMVDGDHEAAQLWTSMAGVTVQLSQSARRMRPQRAGGPPGLAEMRQQVRRPRTDVAMPPTPPSPVTPGKPESPNSDG